MSKEDSTITRQLGRGMLIVLAANVIKMIFNVLLNFIQPKYLSVDTYAAIKTFTLYLSATGIFHLGYEDGTYLKYGGKPKNEINREELSTNISTLQIFQLIISILILLLGWVMDDNVLMIFALILLPYNMTMHFRLFYQAVGDFKLYGRIMNCSTAILFAGDMALIFLFHRDDYSWYLIVQVIVYVIVWIVLEHNLMRTMNLKIRFWGGRVHELVRNIKSGFFIMVGNFSSIFLTSMDRWFVKGLMTSVDFAEYSFAVSMEGFLTVAISPFTITLYNYFCREKQVEKIKRIHNYILLFATGLVATAYPIKFILETWLPSYIPSVSVLFYLFGSQILFIIIKSVYVNLYKARQQQNRYFIKLIIVLISGIFFNRVCYHFWRAKEAMALGTLMSALLWFILCQLDFKEIRYDLKHFCYLFIEMVSFLIIGNDMNAAQGFIVYVLITVFSAFVLVREDVMTILAMIKNIFSETKT